MKLPVLDSYNLDIERGFWRSYIGRSRKRLAQFLNFIYPSEFTWSEDPRLTIEKFFPMAELEVLVQGLTNEEDQLDDIERSGIARFEELLRGNWFDIRRPDF